MTKSTTLLAISIALLQIFDIIIHAATNQIEILRVTSNVAILLWLVMVGLKKLNTKFLKVSIGSIALYLILNLIFLAQAGLTNPEQNGELRVMLFILVFLTTVLSSIFAYFHNKQK